jgi:hypothetical protein
VGFLKKIAIEVRVRRHGAVKRCQRFSGGFDPRHPLWVVGASSRKPPVRARTGVKCRGRVLAVSSTPFMSPSSSGWTSLQSSSGRCDSDRALRGDARQRGSLQHHALVLVDPSCRLLSDVSRFDSERAHNLLVPADPGAILRRSLSVFDSQRGDWPTGLCRGPCSWLSPRQWIWRRRYERWLRVFDSPRGDCGAGGDAD